MDSYKYSSDFIVYPHCILQANIHITRESDVIDNNVDEHDWP